MKKFFGIFLLLILLSGCKDIYRVKTIGIDEELYIKGISRVPGGRASYPYMKYYGYITRERYSFCNCRELYKR